MSEQSLIEAAKAPVLAYNEKNWAAVKASIAPGYLYDEIGTERIVKGAEEVVACWQGWATAMPNSKAEIKSALVSGQSVVLELIWKGTHTGPLQTPGGTISPTGRPFDLRACQVTEILNGKALSTRHYFDMASLLRKLGVTA